VLPRAGWVSRVMPPAIKATRRAAMVRPRPVPPYLRVVEVSSCSKAWKIFACFSGGMPMPVSRTEKDRETTEYTEDTETEDKEDEMQVEEQAGPAVSAIRSVSSFSLCSVYSVVSLFTSTTT